MYTRATLAVYAAVNKNGTILTFCRGKARDAFVTRSKGVRMVRVTKKKVATLKSILSAEDFAALSEHCMLCTRKRLDTFLTNLR